MSYEDKHNHSSRLTSDIILGIFSGLGELFSKGCFSDITIVAGKTESYDICLKQIQNINDVSEWIIAKV